MRKVERLFAQVSSNKEQPAGSGCLVNFWLKSTADYEILEKLKNLRLSWL